MIPIPKHEECPICGAFLGWSRDLQKCEICGHDDFALPSEEEVSEGSYSQNQIERMFNRIEALEQKLDAAREAALSACGLCGHGKADQAQSVLSSALAESYAGLKETNND